MAGKGHRKTAAKAIALAQVKPFQASTIHREVLAHPAMDGRPFPVIALGVYLGKLAENGYLIVLPTETTGQAKYYAVRGGRMEGTKLGEKIRVRSLVWC